MKQTKPAQAMELRSLSLVLGRLEVQVAREPIPTWYFALVVVRKSDCFLLVHELEGGQLWYLPAGRAEFGETLAAAACRETLEEAGIPIRLTGLLRLEHSPDPRGARVRAIFLAEPVDETIPKSVPDSESLGAAWVSLVDLPQYGLREPEVEQLLRHVTEGGAVYPLGVLRAEGSPFTGGEGAA
jgi:8-oxo-dGTP pyrophosphatase MutT (NUDIX family)